LVNEHFHNLTDLHNPYTFIDFLSLFTYPPSMTIDHALIGGKLHVYKRDNSRFWQCSTYLAGRNHRTTTKEQDLEHAKGLAEEWYLSLRVKHRAGELKG